MKKYILYSTENQENENQNNEITFYTHQITLKKCTNTNVDEDMGNGNSYTLL